MMNEDGLVFLRMMTQQELEQWIQNMEDHMREQGIGREYMVPYTLRYITQGTVTWWKIRQTIQGNNGTRTWEEFKTTLFISRLNRENCDNPMKKPCACKICGEIGHTQEEHKGGCPHCEENHPEEECPTRLVTCFLCEGTTHFPAQCQMYPKVQEVIKQQKEAMKGAFREGLEEPVLKKDVDPNGEGLTRFYSNACYSCGEEGHFSQYCTKGRKEYLGYFPTEAVEYDPQEIENLIGTKKSKKRKQRPPQNIPIPTEKDLSHITCFKCKNSGHYSNKCPGKKPRTPGACKITKKPRDLSKIICFHYKEAGHYATKCPVKKKAK